MRNNNAAAAKNGNNKKRDTNCIILKNKQKITRLIAIFEWMCKTVREEERGKK